MVLDASNDQLAQLSESIGNLKRLTHLLFGVNQLTLLPISIGNLFSLTSLSLNKSQITVLRESISCLLSLFQMSLFMNPFVSTEEGDKEIRRRFCWPGFTLGVL